MVGFDERAAGNRADSAVFPALHLVYQVGGRVLPLYGAVHPAFRESRSHRAYDLKDFRFRFASASLVAIHPAVDNRPRQKFLLAF